MKYYYGLEFIGQIFVKNIIAMPKIVVLLPVTRTGPKNRMNWEKILSIIDNSEVAALIVIDKTPMEEATKFFSNSFSFEDTDLYILRRPPQEAIYDSQGYISIDSQLWILQLHDDDCWDGVLAIPKNAKGFQLFTTEFSVRNVKKRSIINWQESPPARINFTLLPSEIWNRFTKYIKSQGGHVAGSSDSTLDLVSRLTCQQTHIGTFTYSYDNRHWRTRISASKNLKTLARQDGWNDLSGIDISILNRTLDGISAINYFEDLTKPGAVDCARKVYQAKLKVSNRRLILLKLRLFSFRLIISILKRLATCRGNFGLARLSNRLHTYIYLDDLILRIGSLSSREELVRNIVVLRESKQFPLLSERFKFWEEYIR